jgi:hypothetical protein
MLATVAYTAIGRSRAGGVILGQVIINSQSTIDASGRLTYSVVSSHFECAGQTLGSVQGTNAGSLFFPQGRAPGTVVPGNAIWEFVFGSAGQWKAITGVDFLRVDHTVEPAGNYHNLAPILKFSCDNNEGSSNGPFIPSTLVLTV